MSHSYCKIWIHAIIGVKYKQALLRDEWRSNVIDHFDNIEAKGGVNVNCSGILLYPTVQCDLNESFQKKNHSIRIKTINLNQDWKLIEKDLLRIIEN